MSPTYPISRIGATGTGLGTTSASGLRIGLQRPAACAAASIHVGALA